MRCCSNILCLTSCVPSFFALILVTVITSEGTRMNVRVIVVRPMFCYKVVTTHQKKKKNFLLTFTRGYTECNMS